MKMKENVAQVFGFVLMVVGLIGCVLIFALSEEEMFHTVIIATSFLLVSLVFGAILNSLGQIQSLLEYLVEREDKK